ncbi:MAG: fibronectin type III domain-containing protein [Clostridia bacterium]|nr:fibronectin type III domain-containing protein [Clostridia bacterium]
MPIGSHYTCLIDEPKATNGENDGQIYLIWGVNREKNLSHYELYRSEKENFKANKKTFVCNVYPEPFVIARHVDVGLKINTRYYYKVRAVNKNGVKGDFSKEFLAKTKEHIE